MKYVILTSLIGIFACQAFAAEVYFRSGMRYVSEYNDHVGRASLIMTGNPGYVLISTDSNKCERDSCSLVSLDGDVNLVLYHLNKVKEENSLVTYEAKPVPLSDLGRSVFVPEYESKWNDLKVTVEADVSRSGSLGGSTDMKLPKAVTLNIGRGSSLRRYILDQTSSVSF